jgi:hypothetical protein
MPGAVGVAMYDAEGGPQVEMSSAEVEDEDAMDAGTFFRGQNQMLGQIDVRKCNTETEGEGLTIFP